MRILTKTHIRNTYMCPYVHMSMYLRIRISELTIDPRLCFLTVVPRCRAAVCKLAPAVAVRRINASWEDCVRVRVSAEMYCGPRRSVCACVCCLYGDAPQLRGPAPADGGSRGEGCVPPLPSAPAPRRAPTELPLRCQPEERQHCRLRWPLMFPCLLPREEEWTGGRERGRERGEETVPMLTVWGSGGWRAVPCSVCSQTGKMGSRGSGRKDEGADGNGRKEKKSPPKTELHVEKGPAFLVSFWKAFLYPSDPDGRGLANLCLLSPQAKKLVQRFPFSFSRV